MIANNLLDAALGYALRGLRVFPLHTVRGGRCTCGAPECGPAGKHPRTEHGCHDATTDPDQLRRWWQKWPEANIGLATGAGSGIVVLDLDPRHGGNDELLAELVKEAPELGVAPRVRTGSGGLHLYLGHPGADVGNKAGLRPGLDIRGDGGYVVAPPSGHASGNSYAWVLPLDGIPLEPFPVGVLCPPEPPRSPRPASTARAPGPRTPWAEAALQKEYTKAASASEGQRNDQLNASAFSLGQLLPGGWLERERIEAELREAAERAGLPATEVESTIRSGLKSGMREPRGPKEPEAPAAKRAELSRAPKAKKSRQRDQGQDLGLEDVAPAEHAVQGKALVAEIGEALERYVIFPPGGALIVSLWAIMSHLVEHLDLMPRLLFSSPTRGCGKTRALDVLSYLAPRPVKAVSISPSFLFRVIEAGHPTIFFDEVDQAGLNADEAGEMRRLLNAGHSRATAWAMRTVGRDFTPRRFRVFCPMALAGIGRLPDTVESRCVRIPMKRRGPGESVERMREKVLTRELGPVCSRIARWALDHGNKVEMAEPVPPRGLEDRDAENAEPLCAIADELGVGVEARSALLSLRGGAEAMEENAALMMLSDLRDVLEERGGEVTSQGFRALLVAMEERPWATWRRGQEITAHGVGRLLSPFGITTRNIRSAGSQVKGYVLDLNVEDAFRRYLPSPSPESPSQPSASSQGAPMADAKRDGLWDGTDRGTNHKPSQAPEPSQANPHGSRAGTVATLGTVTSGGGYGEREVEVEGGGHG